MDVCGKPIDIQKHYGQFKRTVKFLASDGTISASPSIFGLKLHQWGHFDGHSTVDLSVLLFKY